MNGLTTTMFPRQIYIPFKSTFNGAIYAGRKTCTSRTRRYGSPGDYFFIARRRFKLTLVSQIALGIVARYYYEAEGFYTPDEFIKCWNELHPGRGYDPELKIWLHFFEAVKE